MRAATGGWGHTFLARLAARTLLRVRADLPGSEHVPRRKRHTLGPDHRDHVPLKVARHDVPLALVDAEGCLTVVACVLVRAGDDPGRGVGDALYEQDGVGLARTMGERKRERDLRGRVPCRP